MMKNLGVLKQCVRLDHMVLKLKKNTIFSQITEKIKFIHSAFLSATNTSQLPKEEKHC